MHGLRGREKKDKLDLQSKHNTDGSPKKTTKNGSTAELEKYF